MNRVPGGRVQELGLFCIEEATYKEVIITYRFWEVRDWKVTFVYSEVWWMVVAFREWVIENNGIGSVFVADGNTVEYLVFSFGALNGDVGIVVKVANRKELKPSL